MKSILTIIAHLGILHVLCLMFMNLLSSAAYCIEDQSQATDTIIAKLEPPKFEITEVGPFLSGVHGMAMDNKGVLYYADTYSKADDISKIYILPPPYTGTPDATNIEGISIAGLMWKDEYLSVSFLNSNEIIRYDTNLVFFESRSIDSPYNFSNDGETTFVLTYYGEIGKITNYRVRIFVKDLTSPFDIVFSKRESLWISQRGLKGAAGSVSEIGYDGYILNTLDQKFKDPRGLGIDENGNLYIADYGDNKIYMHSWEGDTYLVSDQYTSPICVLKMPDGRMMINTEHNGGMLLIISMSR